MNNQKTIKQQQDNRKTILYVWNYLEWGGVQIYFLGLMRSVSDQYHVKAVLPEGSDNKLLTYLNNNNIEYDFFDARIDTAKAETVGRRIRRRWNDFRTNLILAKHLSKFDLKNSIVQIDVAPWAGFVLLFYLSLKTDVFITFHTAIPEISLFRRVLWQIKFAVLDFFKSFHLAASNLDVKRSLRRFVRPKSYNQIKVIYSSVNISEIEDVLRENKTRREIADKYDFPSEKIWVCNVAQFIERKGCWTFLEAIEILSKQRDDLFFFWLGTSPLTDEIHTKINEFNLQDNFRFLSADETGTRKELLTLWKTADLFVLPSFQEGLPVALVEAMALGKACIASDINAIPEAIKHFETGILVAPQDSEKLAAAIGDLANDENRRRTLGENAQKIVLENFEEKVTGQIMLKLYESVFE